MIGVKEMRANLGAPGGMPKTHASGPSLNHRASAMKDALSSRRRNKVAKMKMAGQNAIKPLGADPDEMALDTSFIGQDGN